MNLAITRAFSLDNINVAMLKKAITVLCLPLALIINKSFETGKVSKKLKLLQYCFINPILLIN